MTTLFGSGLLGGILGAAAVPAIRRSLRESYADRQVWIFVVLANAAAGTVVAAAADGTGLVAYLAFVTFGTALGVVDVLEQRLPGRLIAAGWTVVAILLLAAALLDDGWPDLIRALAASAVLGGGHLLLALAVPGGLGAGDVKMMLLVGLPLGYVGWPTVVLATLAGWTAAAIAMLLLGLRRHVRQSTIPMGPFMFGGAVLVLGLEAHLHLGSVFA
jgi:leader peptidase (prepilin peptidase)/N-methyltransferase